jgi:hypothetical protein
MPGRGMEAGSGFALHVFRSASASDLLSRLRHHAAVPPVPIIAWFPNELAHRLFIKPRCAHKIRKNAAEAPAFFAG